jgi:hypothetical protein
MNKKPISAAPNCILLIRLSSQAVYKPNIEQPITMKERPNILVVCGRNKKRSRAAGN